MYFFNSSLRQFQQSDPLALPMYVLATKPLTLRASNDVTQVWYAKQLLEVYNIFVSGVTTFLRLGQLLAI